jgi:hypothetical protein
MFKNICFIIVIMFLVFIDYYTSCWVKRGLELENYCVGDFGKFIKFNKIMKIQKHEFYSIKI